MTLKVVLIYAKSQVLRERAAAVFADEKAVKGEMARDEIYPPLGIAILAAGLLQRGGYDVRLLDDSIEDFDKLRSTMEWADVVGISSLTPNARRARELGQIARNELHKFVVMGGPHPTTNPEFFLDAGAADICVQGEGDLTLPEVLENYTEPYKWGEILGITYMKDGEMVKTPRRPLVKKVDELPFPAYHLYDIPRYMRLMVNPGVTLITSRGCPYACTFCDAEMTPRQYRAMSPERTVDLIEHLLVTYNPPQMMFFDDLFTIQRKRVIAVCKEIIRRGLYFEWACESRLDTMDFELLRWMRKAGCVKIYYGLESGSPDVLVSVKKGLTVEKIQAAAKLNREVGMYFKYFLMFGFPQETKKDHKLTEYIVTSTRPDSICVSLLQPIPGTEIYEQLKPYLLRDVAEIDFHYWHGTETYKHPNFTFDELRTEREGLIKTHAKVTRSLKSRLSRKLERLRAMIQHPELISDWFEVRRRRAQYRSRVRSSEWRGSFDRTQRDQVALQVPTVTVD
ncbi:MAG: cobalamin-dependent protein [Planctomycetes bacterium]|nr:cobalamin-dependent protein [Planctomycetota bacterium]